MLLRNYYTGLTNAAIGNKNITEDVSQTLSPRYSRNIAGDYVLAGFTSNFISSEYNFYFSYGATMNRDGVKAIGFGNNTTPPTFNDYIPTGNTATKLTAVKKTDNTVYDDNTKTYTNTSNYTLTNNTENDLEINEIMLGSSGTACYYTRDLLGENSFIIGANDSVNFEITIKYTIAEPLQ